MRLDSGRFDRIQQLLEIAVGAFAHRLSDCLGRCGGRCFVVGCRLGQTGQCGQQFRRGRSRFDAFTDLAEHRVHGVECLQNDVHQFGIDSTLTLTQDVEDVFGNVAAFHQLMKLEKARTALDRMEPAKNRIEQRHVIGAAFQLHELLGQ